MLEVDHLLDLSFRFIYVKETNTWIKGNCNGYSRRVFETAVVFKDAMYLYGGLFVTQLFVASIFFSYCGVCRENIHNYSFNELSMFTFGIDMILPLPSLALLTIDCTLELPIEVSCSDTYLNDLKHLLYIGEYSDVQFIFLKGVAPL